MTNLLNVNELELGMVLAKDVIDENTGIILIGKDMGITEGFIDHLIKNEIKEVYIKNKEVSKKKHNKSLIKGYENIEEILEEIFNSVREGKEIFFEKIDKDMTKYIQEIIKERNILGQMRLIKKKDDYTFNHSIAVSTLAASLGSWLDYSDQEIVELGIAGLLHDIGKLQISENIINKPGELTEEEFELIKKHSLYSSLILSKSGEFSEDIILGILHHHERMDGSGYPNKLKGDKIHKYGKILAICDVYHALTSRRVYKDKENPLNVADYIRKEGFTKLDPSMTQVFLKNISKFYVGNRVVLSTGKIGEIIYIHPQDDTKAIVKVGNEFIDFLKEKEIKIIDLII